jgi:hypothetical protein
MNTNRLIWILVALAIGIGLSVPAVADPLPGEFLKFQQLPLNNGLTPYYPVPVPGGAPYYGHDELSTASRTSPNIPWNGTFMADDFADKFDTPVVHIRWWGSYLDDNLGNPANPGVKQFLISFESDVPVGPNNPLPFSHPGTPLLNQIVRLGPLAPGSGTFTEKLLPTPLMPGMPPREALYEYNAELHLDKFFPQQRDTVYWLKIVALVDDQQDGPIRWGWHSRDWSIPNPLASTAPAVVPGEHTIPGAVVIDPDKGFTSPIWHFQDDAVSGTVNVFPNPNMPIMPGVEQFGYAPENYLPPWDGPSIIGQFSKDLAFELYSVPEPSTVLLACLACLAFAVSAFRRTWQQR